MVRAVLPDFNNTEIAFRARSSLELRKAQWLFRSFNYKWLTYGGERALRLAFKLHLPVQSLVRFAFFDHFCGGTTIADSMQRVQDLGRFQVRSILDYSVEGQQSEAAFDAALQETLKIIETAANNRQFLPFTAIKMTGIGRFDLLAKASTPSILTHAETAELKLVATRLQRLCVASAAAGLHLLVDAEETWIQAAVDRLVQEQMEAFNHERVVVYNTLQMYRTDRLEMLHALAAAGKAKGFKPGVKLVRGAYMEKERARAAERREVSPIHASKEATDASFDLAVAFCIEHIDDLALFAGTHNEQSIRALAQHMATANLVPQDERVECSQLLGMSDHLTYNLADKGYRVSKYVPYGPVEAVLPYLARRAEENSAVAGQAQRELELIERELERRG
jgi:proline dehydrogenase